jgi:hypothetical protein
MDVPGKSDKRKRKTGRQEAKRRRLYKTLLAAFVEAPGNVSGAARAASCHNDTARRAWEHGWPEQGLAPIHQVLAEQFTTTRALRAEKQAAEAALEEARQAANEKLAEAEAKATALVATAEQEAERRGRQRLAEFEERAHLDAAEQRADEATLCRAARRNALAVQGFVASVLQNARVLAEKITSAIQSGALTPQQALSFGDRMVRGARDAHEAAKLALQLERIRVGDPTEIIAVKVEPASLDEAARDMQHAADVLELMRRRGLVAVGNSDEKSTPN